MSFEHALQGLLVLVGVVIYIARGINKLREKAAAGVARAAAAQRIPTIRQHAANAPAPQSRAAARKLAAAQQPFVMQRGWQPQQTATQVPAAPQRPATPQRPAEPQRPAAPQRPRQQAAAARTPAMDFSAEAAAFQILELTLPDAGFGDPATPRAARRTAKRVWGANAIVAMEVLGPPVSLRSGATLGAPHAF